MPVLLLYFVLNLLYPIGMSKKEKVTYLRCALPKCDNPLTGKQRKFCSRKCLIKANCLARKDVYKDLNG